MILIRYHFPHYCKTFFGTQEGFWHTKSFGNWEDPPPPWGKFPKNPVFFVWVWGSCTQAVDNWLCVYHTRVCWVKKKKKIYKTRKSTVPGFIFPCASTERQARDDIYLQPLSTSLPEYQQSDTLITKIFQRIGCTNFQTYHIQTFYCYLRLNLAHLLSTYKRSGRN